MLSRLPVLTLVAVALMSLGMTCNFANQIRIIFPMEGELSEELGSGFAEIEVLLTLATGTTNLAVTIDGNDVTGALVVSGWLVEGTVLTPGEGLHESALFAPIP